MIFLLPFLMLPLLLVCLVAFSGPLLWVLGVVGLVWAVVHVVRKWNED